ncbi:dihydrodipicolinate synthase family protein [Acuticoccus mangrovi]|uniref:Dihydrodipicolinate synthase family protein n=1 Tax=Acuticoccus mangrovi TaxID=2796142 RepID=A0A934MHS0_9HYPH|nr:dihydrodipicolinate synthase family protein [Acuticoccus mangrovi]
MTASAFPETSGVSAACLVPFNDDYSVDEAGVRQHVRDILLTEGLSGLAQSSEVEVLSFEEWQRFVDIMLEEVNGRIPVIASVYGEGREAVEAAQSAEKAGASTLMVYPPKGGPFRPEVAHRHIGLIADACSLPIMLYQFPAATGRGYTFDTVMKLVDTVPAITSLKDWGNDPALHQRFIRTLQTRDVPVNVISAHSAWLMGSLAMGCNGLCSSIGSIMCDLQLALFRAIKADDLVQARAVNDKLVPITDALYVPPTHDLHNRTKEVLFALGRIPSPVVRPPLVKLPENEVNALREAIVLSGLEKRG